MGELEPPVLAEVGKVMQDSFGFYRDLRDSSYEAQLSVINALGSSRAESVKTSAQALRCAERALVTARLESAACAERLREVQSAQDRLVAHRVFYPRCACPHTELCGLMSTVRCKQCELAMCERCAAVHRAGRDFVTHELVEAAFHLEAPQAKRVKTERQ
jgi:hypothetical protein